MNIGNLNYPVLNIVVVDCCYKNLLEGDFFHSSYREDFQSLRKSLHLIGGYIWSSKNIEDGNHDREPNGEM